MTSHIYGSNTIAIL